MKKLLVALCLLSFAQARSAFANESTYSTQTSSDSSITLQISGGLGFSSISTNDPMSSYFLKSRTGLNTSLMVDIPLSDSLSINTGVAYIQKGANFSMDFGSMLPGASSLSATYSLNYLVLPLTLQGKIDLGSNTLSLGAGPFAAFALNRKLESKNVLFGDDVNSQMSSMVSKTDFGVRMGAHFMAPLSTDFSFLVGMNYDLGLKNINADGSNASVKTGSLLADVGLGIEL